MNDNEVNIQMMKEKVKQFTAERQWTDSHSPKNLSMSIAIEAAELMEFFQWMSVEESWEIKNSKEKFTHLQEELSDVLIYCLSLANQLDIDVTTAIEDKLRKNAEKYPLKVK